MPSFAEIGHALEPRKAIRRADFAVRNGDAVAGGIKHEVQRGRFDVDLFPLDAAERELAAGCRHDAAQAQEAAVSGFGHARLDSQGRAEVRAAVETCERW